MYLECPDSIRVYTLQKPEMSGIYSKINQTRRQKPVWYNSLNDAYIFLSISNDWHISEAKHYTADNTFCLAFADGKNARCPQDLDYTIWLNNTWIGGTGVSVTSRKHDFWLFRKCNPTDSSFT